MRISLPTLIGVSLIYDRWRGAGSRRLMALYGCMGIGAVETEGEGEVEVRTWPGKCCGENNAAKRRDPDIKRLCRCWTSE